MFLAPVAIHIQKQPQSPERMSNSSVTKKFPVKFWRLLHSCTGDALCWGVGGNSVRILKETFEKEYLLGINKPFKTCSFSSFVRQLNLYGFRKVMRPVITNEYGQKLNTSLVEYKHPMFMKGHPELLLHINRKTSSHKRDKRNELSHGINKLKRKISEGSLKQSHEQKGKALKIENHVVLDNITNKTNWTSRIDRVYIRGPFPQPIKGNTHNTTETKKRSCVAGSSENDIKIMSTTSLAQADSTWTGKAKIHTEGKERPCKTDYCEADSTVERCPGTTSTEASAKVEEDRQDFITHALAPGTFETGGQCGYTSQHTGIPVPGSHVVSGTLVPGSIHGQAILYMNKGPQLMFKMKSMNQTTTKPSQPVQPLKNSNGGQYKPGASLFSATCEDVASHPLLQPKNTYLQHTSTGTHGGPKSGQFPPETLPDKQMKSSTALKTIPKNSPLPSMADQTALLPLVPQESDELTDLLSFKLSPSLKDIDAPTVSSDAHGSEKDIPDMKISDLNLLNTLQTTSVLNMSYYRTPSGKLGVPQPRGEQEPNVVVKDTTSHQTDAARQSQKSGGRWTSTSASTQTTEVDITSPQKASTTVNTELPEGREDHPHPQPQWEQLDERSSSGPKRELFKENLGKRVITIPISGLPQDLFKLGMLGSGITDTNQVMVRLETSECGVVTGHLILPCK